MPYNQPLVLMHKLEPVDFGAGTYAGSIKAPPGVKKGRILDIGITDITETFACDGTTAKVRLGTTGDADAYCELVIPDATAATDTFNARDDADAIIQDGIADASVQLEVTTVQSVDGSSAAGIATPYVTIAWY